MEKKPKIKASEWVFIKEYAETHNASEAYKKAFPKTNPAHAKQYAYKLRKKPHIQEAIEKAYEEAIGPNQKIVIENIKFWQRMRDDESIKESDRIAAARDLAKFGGMFTEKKEVDIKGQVQIVDDI